MKLLIYLKIFRDRLTGRELQKTLSRNAAAADELDRAVKEMLNR